MIYLAPLQGFTDFVYRKAYAQVFTGVDAYFIPYISMKNNLVLSKYKKEILLSNNPQHRVVPQVLAENAREMLLLAAQLSEIGYSEINLNMGCPYSMVTNRGKGSGLLPFPEKLEAILTSYFEKSSLELSVKLRAGLHSSEEVQRLIPVLNKFPLKEVILHPRIAKQLYSGRVIDDTFQFVQQNLKHRLVFNGDIFTISDFQYREKQFPGTETYMLGRGILMNPFLPAEINQIVIPVTDRREKLHRFHFVMLKSYLEVMDNEGNALNKLKQFWFYFSYNFPNQTKAFKQIKKTNSIPKYQAVVDKLFYQLY